MSISSYENATIVNFYNVVEKQGDLESQIPLYLSRISAGFPSPADDYVELKIDFNALLVDKAHATFCVRVKGNSMEGAGILDGAILIVDRSKEPADGKIVVGIVNGEFTVKRILKSKKGICLVAEHPAYDPIWIKEGMEFQVFGVVTYIINRAK